MQILDEIESYLESEALTGMMIFDKWNESLRNKIKAYRGHREKRIEKHIEKRIEKHSEKHSEKTNAEREDRKTG